MKCIPISCWFRRQMCVVEEGVGELVFVRVCGLRVVYMFVCVSVGVLFVREFFVFACARVCANLCMCGYVLVRVCGL